MVFISYILVRRTGASVEEARTVETIVFCVVGLRVIAAIERPLRGWRLGLALAMAALLALTFSVPYARSFFALELPNWEAIAVTVASCVVAWFIVGLGWRIGNRLPFWREPAQRAEEVAS
jgi:cation-transporting P-type ATPase E